MLDERRNIEPKMAFTYRILVTALISGLRPQFARVPADDLLTEVCATAFQRSQSVNVENSLSLGIDNPCGFQRVNAVVRAVAAMTAHTVAFVEYRVKCSLSERNMQLRRRRSSPRQTLILIWSNTLHKA
jgi:hypothetical protein